MPTLDVCTSGEDVKTITRKLCENKHEFLREKEYVENVQRNDKKVKTSLTNIQKREISKLIKN